jgi:hypothetical protein
MALSKLGLSGFQAVMIGDTPYEAEAASGAGTAAAGVLTGGFSIESLRGAGCFAVAGERSGLLASLRGVVTLSSRVTASQEHRRRGGIGDQPSGEPSPRGNHVPSR